MSTLFADELATANAQAVTPAKRRAQSEVAEMLRAGQESQKTAALDPRRFLRKM
jgi:hypothetical protein